MFNRRSAPITLSKALENLPHRLQIKSGSTQLFFSVCHCGNAILSIFYTSTLMSSPSTTTL
jgi:hypothetical protein